MCWTFGLHLYMLWWNYCMDSPYFNMMLLLFPNNYCIQFAAWVSVYWSVNTWQKNKIFLCVHLTRQKNSIVLCVRRQKQFFCGCYTHRKIMFGKIKNKISVHYSSQKKEKPNRKIIFLLVLSRQSCRGALTGKKKLYFSVGLGERTEKLYFSVRC